MRDTFAQVLGAEVVVPADIDTDQFGTFTGDVPRTLDPVAAGDDLDHYLHRAGFPEQALVVRCTRGGTLSTVAKGVTGRDDLVAATATARDRSDDGHALLEPDLRAHHNPTRRMVLTRLGQRLAQRLATPCPACACPGYGRTDTERGLPCTACATPTDLITADVHTCGQCAHQHRVCRAAITADPRWCPLCNP